MFICNSDNFACVFYRYKKVREEFYYKYYIKKNKKIKKIKDMLKYGLLAVNTEKNEHVNIGDYVQALAARQFLDGEYLFIERERLDQYNGEEVKMIMNGWYMHHPENWPPSPKIIPLFLSFHINVLAKEGLLSSSSIKYLKNHEPIGCRDYNTASMLMDNGIDAYFSGCMTLTLGLKYKSTAKDDTYYFVDAYYDRTMDLASAFRSMKYILKKPFFIKKLSIRMFGSSSVKKLLSAAKFYSIYSKIFTDEILISAFFKTQQDPIYSGKTNKELIDEAEELINGYAKAKLVVTSRIHCALPCLAIETPVLYVENYNQSEASSCRLNGLRELFNIVLYKNDSLELKFNKSLKKISPSSNIKNSKAYLDLANDLIKKCTSFIKN